MTLAPAWCDVASLETVTPGTPCPSPQSVCLNRFLLLLLVPLFDSSLLPPPPPAAPKPYQTSQTPTNVKSTLSISPFSDLFEEAKLGTAVVQHRAVSTPKPVIQGAHILFRLDNWDDPAYLHFVKQKLSSLLSRIFLK